MRLPLKEKRETDSDAATLPPFGGAPELSGSEFNRIRRLAYDHFGLDLKEGKQTLVTARLGKALRRKGFTTFRQYIDHLTGDHTGEALRELADALTTNFTSFMRESAHFDYLRDNLLAPGRSRTEFEVWSAACSTGEEPYTILFTMLEALGEGAKVRVFATDISRKALGTAEAAVYEAARLETLPENWLRRYFLRGTGKWAGWYRVKDRYREMVRYARLNLIADDLPRGRFTAIFCRNVMIYFDKPTQAAVVRRLAPLLEPGGCLFIGHSETLAGIDHGLAYVGPAVYRMPGKDGVWTKRPGC